MRVRSAGTIAILAAGMLLSGCYVLGKVTGMPSASAGAYAQLISKKDELAKVEPKGTPDGQQQPIIKGKVVIVKSEGPGQAFLDRFDWEGNFSDAPVDRRWRFYPAEVYAKTPEEIGTLIKIDCREHVGSDYYKASPNSDSQRQSFSKSICDVSVIDYKDNTLLAKIQKGDESSPGVIKLGEAGGGHYEVLESIGDYLKSFPLELIPRVKPTPSGKVITVAELADLYKRSKESVGIYQDKEITVSGWGMLVESINVLYLAADKSRTGVNQIQCKIDAGDMPDLAGIKRYELYKFTVVGTFDAKYSLALERCRFVDGDRIAPK